VSVIIRAQKHFKISSLNTDINSIALVMSYEDDGSASLPAAQRSSHLNF